jgi:hypothetical protein
VLNRTTVVNLRANNNNQVKYVSATNGGGGVVTADRDAASIWEQFVIESIGPLHDGGQVYVRTFDNTHFLVGLFAAPGGLTLAANSTTRALATTFTVRRVAGPGEIHSGDLVALQSVATGKYVVAEGGGGGAVKADRTERGPWETFQIIFR